MYNVVYFGFGCRQHVCEAPTWTRALEAASHFAVRKDKPFPITIRDPDGNVVHEIKGLDEVRR
jgi:hypothetical protein